MSRGRAPAVSSRAAAAKQTTIAVPRSGSTITSRQADATATRNGAMGPIPPETSFGRVASRCAP